MPAKKSLKVLVIGSTGLVGSRFVELSKNKFSITTCGRENVDIFINLLSQKELSHLIESLEVDAIINFAAYTNIDEAEKEKGDTNGEVYTINTLLPSWLIKSCQDTGKKLYHISTDYVFDGQKDNRPYKEEDIPSPVNSWYSMTKYFGEQNILNKSDHRTNSAIIRISYPYSGLYKRKLDIARAVVERLKNNEPYFGIKDQKIKPTSVEDIAQALSFILNRNLTGIFHIAGDYSPKEHITPFEFAKKIAKEMNMNTSLIKPISFKELSKKRVAPRPQHTWLDTTKIELMGFKITGIDDALNRFKNQMIRLK